MKKTLLLGLLLCAALCGCSNRSSDRGPDAAKPAAGQIAPIEYQTQVLDNGLRVVYAPLRNAPVVHVRVLYHVGSKDEKPDRNGFAHMFEHMMFRGSAHVAPEEHMRRINSVGGISNAFTSFDQTTYVNTVPSEHAEMALYLEADRMASFKVSEEIYATERKVVAEEWRMRMNQPYGNLYEEFLKNAYARHSYRWTPIGNMDHLRAAAVNELQEFFNAYYVPNNAVLVVAGDIDVPTVRKWVERYYGWIPRGAEPTRLSPREPEQTEGRKSVVPAAVPLPAVLIGARIDPYTSDDHYGLALLSEILGGGRSSRLSMRLVSGDKPLCTSAQAMHMPLEDGGIFGVMGMLLAGKSPEEAEAALRDEVARLVDKGVTQEELEKARAQYKQELVEGRKTAENIARAVGEEWLWAGDPARANRDWAKVQALTPADLGRLAAKYLQPARMTTLYMTPDPSGKAARQAAEGAKMTAEVTKASAEVKPRPATFPADYPKQAPLSKAVNAAHFNKGVESTINGARVIVMTDQRLPLANFTLVMRRGSHSEPAGKEGLAGLTAEMLRRGAGDLSYAKLNELLDSKAISLGVSDGGDVTRLSGSCPSDQLPEAIRIARLILRQPIFPEAEFNKLKAQAMSGLMRSLASPTTVAGQEIDKMLYGDAPQGRSTTPRSLASITLDDVKAYYQRIYQPADAILLLAGDVTAPQGGALARALIGDWPSATPAPQPRYEFPAPSSQRRIVLVDNPDGKQATVRMATPAYSVSSDEKYAGALANQILSGGIESRIMRYVRAEKGLAYSAHGVFSPRRQEGTFTGMTDTKIESAGDAIVAMFKVFDDLRKDKVTADELAESKLRVAGRMVMGMQTIEQQAQYRLDGILNGYPVDYYDQYPAKVAAATDEQILAAMRKYVDSEKMAIVVVGPADKLKPQLEKLGKVEVKPMPAKREELLK